MFKISINNERYLRYCTSEYFNENSNISKNLTLKEASELIHKCCFVKNGQLLYNREESEVVGSIKESNLMLSTSLPRVENLIREHKKRKELLPSLSSLHEVERLHIIKVNEYTSNKIQASKILGITTKTLYNKLTKHGIEWNTNN